MWIEVHYFCKRCCKKCCVQISQAMLYNIQITELCSTCEEIEAVEEMNKQLSLY